jgi:hypothetical protein
VKLLIPKMVVTESQKIAYQALDEILSDFGLARNKDDSEVKFTGEIPVLSQTKSEKINLTLVGAVPSTANALAAARIYQARGGKRQTIEVDLRRGHNYIDPDIGMTPSINGQVSCDKPQYLTKTLLTPC